MQVELRVQNTDLADAIRTYIERRLRFSLSRFGGRVGRVTVRISDLNGPRGGMDKCCRITAELIPTGMVMLEETDGDLYAAIDRATERVGRSFSRELDRQHRWRAKRESVRTPEEPHRRPYVGRR